jgi:RNA polymerase sigma-70 factor (ECF subfamily)
MDSSLQQGMQEASRFWPEIFGLAFQILGDRGRAEDLSQEAYLRLGSMRRPLDRSGSLRHLLLTIVRRLAISELRKRRPQLLGERGSEEAGLEAGGASDPLQQAKRNEQRQVVQQALQRLRPSWRTILFLRDGLGLSYAEIGNVTGKSENVVRVTLHRARCRIREILESQMIGESRT